MEAAKDPRWLPLVMAAFRNSLLRDRAYDNPPRQLVLLKRAVQQVTYNLAAVLAEERRHAGETADVSDIDPLSATMAFLRAAEQVNLRRME